MQIRFGQDLSKNERRALGQVFRRGPISQSQLADILEVTQQSASRIIANLVERGALTPADRIHTGRRGYPTATFGLVAQHAFSVGLSVAPGSATLVLTDFAGQSRRQAHTSWPSVTVPRVSEWARTTVSALTSAEAIQKDQLCGLGISVAGSFQSPKGFNTPFSLEDWAGIDVAHVMQQELGLTAIAENDGNAAALAECLLGVGQWAPSFAYIYIGSGVGGGVILDGEPWRGRHGNAGEFAGGLHQGIHPFPNLELLRQIQSTYGPTFDSVDSLLSGLDLTWPSIDDWISRIKDSLSIIVSNASAILDVDAIVLGGVLPKPLAERLIPHLQFFDQRRRSIDRPMPQIVPSAAPANAAAIGAALLPLRAAFHYSREQPPPATWDVKKG